MDVLVNKHPRDEKKVFVTGAPGGGGGVVAPRGFGGGGGWGVGGGAGGGGGGLVSLRVFGMESHYICPFRYHLVLCIKKFTKTALTLTTQKSPSNSLSLSHTHIDLP